MNISILITSDRTTHIADLSTIIDHCESIKNRSGVDSLNIALRLDAVSALTLNSLNPCNKASKISDEEDNSCSISIMDL